jgi:biopolymer transport protein ExbD
MRHLDLRGPGLARVARWCLVLDGVLLVLLLLWLSWDPDVYEQWAPGVELAVSRTPEEDRWIEDDGVIVSVTRDGRAWWKQEPLDAIRLGALLDERIIAYDEKRRGDGRSGYDELPGGAHASRLRVILRVDRAARWGDVHEVLSIAGQRSLYKVYFLVARAGRRRNELAAFLPMPDREYAYITASIGRDERTSLDGRDAHDLTEAIKAALRALEHDDRAVAGLVDADPDAPFEAVVRALDAFECAGLTGVALAAGSVRAVVVPRPR